MSPSHSRKFSIPHYMCAVAVIALSACGASSKSTTSQEPSGTSSPAGSSDSGSAEGPGEVAKAVAAGKPLAFESASPRSVTSLSYSGSKLAVGFSNGSVALVDPSGGVTQSKASKVYSVAAVSPSGDLSLLSSKPPVIVNAKGDLILQMNTVPDFESAAFGTDGITLYVAAKDGKIRIWGQPHSFEEDQHKEKLENYLNRQAPDFLVELPPIRGPLHVTDAGAVVAVDQEGAVRLWDPRAPSSSKRIMKVGGGARSIASSGNYVIVTSQTGVMKVGLAEGGYLPWSKDSQAAFVGATGVVSDTFFTLDKGVLRGITTENGEEVWATQIPDGHPCGLAVSPDGGTVTACIGNYIATFDAKSGTPKAYGYQADEKFIWKR